MIELLRAPCPTHGVQPFGYHHRADLWACPGMFPGLGNDLERPCWSVVLAEDVARNPDGGDVVDLREHQMGRAITIGLGGVVAP